MGARNEWVWMYDNVPARTGRARPEGSSNRVRGAERGAPARGRAPERAGCGWVRRCASRASGQRDRRAQKIGAAWKHHNRSRASASGRAANGEQELLGPWQTGGGEDQDRLGRQASGKRLALRQHPALGGKVLADRAVVVVVERAVIVAGVLGVGRRLSGGGMVVVVVVVTAAVIVVVAGSGRRVVFEAVGVVMSSDGVEAGVPEERNRAVGRNETADGEFAEQAGHVEIAGPAVLRTRDRDSCYSNTVARFKGIIAEFRGRSMILNRSAVTDRGLDRVYAADRMGGLERNVRAS